MSVSSVFQNVWARKRVQQVVCYGVVPAAFSGLMALANQYKLDAPTHTKAHVEAQAVVVDLGNFLQKAAPDEEALVEAYNTRSAYLGPVARTTLASCFKQSLLEDATQAEMAQTLPQQRMNSYRAPMASDLKNTHGPAVAVTPFSQVKLTDCAKAASARFAATPTAAEMRRQYYRDIGSFALGGLFAGNFLYLHRRRRTEAAARPQ